MGDPNKESNSQTDSIRNELSTPTTWYEPSKTESEENVGVQSSTLKENRKSADKRSCKRLDAVPLVDLSNDTQCKFTPRVNLDPADVYACAKANQVHPIKSKKDPF